MKQYLDATEGRKKGERLVLEIKKYNRNKNSEKIWKTKLTSQKVD